MFQQGVEIRERLQGCWFECLDLTRLRENSYVKSLVSARLNAAVLGFRV